ncbi:MAG: PQQ-dependent dehydrogenase, methanol/ethanol family [Sphingomonadales bacterium]|nr:PQQ-dependent dehydrogenase, methanol/ethanol family [Sphingomonadales bacterium]PIX67606.1 MAG: PQQ-dependent dehydrogenase, methanol/ethanol family [Sphingomonadales bacterium CG_4_10_14_3_um_filter_58_15]NCO47463.1 PQQ-dependent dehydrogenase, methanol/ethanol family [Sphingomonadales bacterium]NCP00561.1 PQQ-dependent dehydrogenase, methanol/ethanol family [Sphingomonadales bacterium]NCP26294.1 PQQ-dependent dehydrogenase, methanol/ethanol family [Sphingomonadales bacterium]
MRRLGILLMPLMLMACESQTSAPEATDVAVEADWSSIGFDAREQRHSPLTQINDGNVDQLGIAWFKDLPDARGQEATPIEVDGKLYISTAWSKVFAYDAKTGEELWSYDPAVDGAKAVDACCDVVNRGVAINRGKLFFGTIDGRLIALDANTGARLWETQTTDNSKPYTITGAPRVVKNMVIIGNGGAEFGVRGYVSAYDTRDGNLKWRFYTVPNPKGEPDGAASDEIFAKAAAQTWGDGEWKESGGGGTVWDSIVYDEDLDQLYFGVGNGNPWNHGLRSGGEGDNLFLSSIVAVNPDTGKYLWHYQETPAETWDYTATQHIIQAEMQIGGKMRKVLYHAPKNGFFFVIDRLDGTLISAEPFVEGINWATGYDMATGRPIENPDARFYKTGKPFVAIPGALGAHNWHPMSYNPKTGLVYIPAQQIPQGYDIPVSEIDKKRERLGFNVGIGWAIGQLPDDKAVYKAAVAATTGKLVAFNPKTGKVEWSVDYPAAWNGGTMTTAGNLVFQGTSTGFLKAYAADTGTELLSLPMQSGIVSAPSTYMVDGEQYVAFLTSKGGAFPLVAGVAGGVTRQVPNLPRLVVLKLGGKAKLPALPAKTEVTWEPPVQTGTPEQIAAGKALYGRNCLVCHGDSAIGNGFTPDLRVSGVLPDTEAWASVVTGGSLKQHGMVGFASQLSPEQVENIRHYVVNRSIWTKKNLPEMTAPTAR